MSLFPTPPTPSSPAPALPADAGAILIHGAADADTALAAAAGRPVLLVGRAATVGPAWFKAVTTAALGRHPGVRAAALLDCGDRPGAVLAALRSGVALIGFRGTEETTQRLSAIAAAYGARLVSPPAAPFDPATLTPKRRADPQALARAWFATDRSH